MTEIFSKRVENTVGQGEIARYEQFLLFPVLSKDLYCRHVKTRACLGKGYIVEAHRIVLHSPIELFLFPQIFQKLLAEKVFINIRVKCIIKGKSGFLTGPNIYLCLEAFCVQK